MYNMPFREQTFPFFPTLFLSALLSVFSLQEGLLSASAAAAAAVADEAAEETEEVEPEDWTPDEATRVAVTEATVVVAVEPKKEDDVFSVHLKEGKLYQLLDSFELECSS